MYVAQCAGLPLTKIGCTCQPRVALRLSDVKYPGREDKPYSVVSIRTNDPYGLERHLHHRFEEKRVTGEWFNLDEQDIEWMKRLDPIMEFIRHKQSQPGELCYSGNLETRMDIPDSIRYDYSDADA